MLVSKISNILSILTVVGDIALVAVAAALFSKKKDKRIKNYAGKHALWLAFVIALISTLGSLFYSEIAQYKPCKLCWEQRIFMYPQVFILGWALYKKYKREVVDYCLALSIIGALISAYHYYLQRWGGSDASCYAVGYSQSCAKNFVLTFGYITIPMMALTAFLLIIASLYFKRGKSPAGSRG